MTKKKILQPLSQPVNDFFQRECFDDLNKMFSSDFSDGFKRIKKNQDRRKAKIRSRKRNAVVWSRLRYVNLFSCGQNASHFILNDNFGQFEIITCNKCLLNLHLCAWLQQFSMCERKLLYNMWKDMHKRSLLTMSDD